MVCTEMKRRVYNREEREKEMNSNWPKINYADHIGRGLEF